MKENIREKMEYCLDCKTKPCSKNGCPLSNDIPEFIKNAKEQNYKKAYEILSKTTVMPGICGEICPNMKQCQGSCIRGIKGQPVNIGDIESYIFEKTIEEKINLKDVIEITEDGKLKDKKVAVIGGGPAGLTCAAFLAIKGINVTIFEKYNYLGGLLVHGIPDFRLNKEKVYETVRRILDLGVKAEFEKELGKNLKLEDLEREYDSIFLSIGANKSGKVRNRRRRIKRRIWRK